mmetsp:Transcript_13488/g.28483  ORF Transcript_13488/g.28483 Transcript_13488/m.28483 type:complete len:226 (-) Transcript_13488:1596-2273(-)
MSLRSSKSPPPGAAGASATAWLSADIGALPNASCCFFCKTFKSTTGILDKASFAALMTEALTLPFPLSVTPNKSSSPAGFVIAVLIPLHALINESYSHARSCSSREWDMSFFLMSLWIVSKATASPLSENRSLSLTKDVNARSLMYNGQECLSTIDLSASTTAWQSRAMKVILAEAASPGLEVGVYVYGFKSRSPYSPMHQIPTTRRPRCEPSSSRIALTSLCVA